MTPVVGWAIPLGLLALAAGLLVGRRRKGRERPLTICEYWVYMDAASLPKTEALMTRMISENPHNRPGRPCIGAREGLLFSDIRLHIGCALKEKNPHAFRPDLFDDLVEPSAAVLSGLAEAKAFARARYLSERPLADTRHLQFMPHLADALSDLGGGRVVFDPVTEWIWTAEEFKQALAARPNAEIVSWHLRVAWRPTEAGGRVETRGLRKVGLPELRSEDLPSDHKTLGLALFEEAAGRLWKDRVVPEAMEIELQGARFRLLFARSGEPRTVRLVRWGDT